MLDVSMVSSDIGSLLRSWHTSIREKNVENANKMRENVTILHDTSYDLPHESLFLTAKLIDLRHHLLKKDPQQTKEIIEYLDSKEARLDRQQQFYYFFLKGLSAYQEKKYEEALLEFKSAENLVDLVDNRIDQGEYNYKIACAYYFVRQSLISVSHVKHAQKIFEDESQKGRIADCEMLLGLNYVDMRQYDIAEEKLHTALMYAKEVSDQELHNRVLHNLGFFYTEQGLSEAGIRYLNSLALDPSYEHNMKACFLICREHCRMGNLRDITEWMKRGLNYLKETPNLEYTHKFRLLNLLYLEPNNFDDDIILESIAYFQEEKQWQEVEEYSKLFAQSYSKTNEYEKAVYFYELALNANKTINYMEALK
ncbi:hypothetical protein [Pseudalkalibacillus sp. SCS-8]|uniref:hypothetical protein n=1 Tax=Pseudalkalibacillus nanhaiensis TaxID=3115291 RepID=UPI0032DB6905